MKNSSADQFVFKDTMNDETKTGPVIREEPILDFALTGTDVFSKPGEIGSMTIDSSMGPDYSKMPENPVLDFHLTGDDDF